MVGKYVLQTSVRELYNYLIKSELDGRHECVWKGKKLVSGTDLKYLTPKQVKKITPRYK